MRHGSLFSGIGGFDLAARWVGWENIFQVEIDPFCQQVLAVQFPETNRFKDVTQFNTTQYDGTIDVISAGFPCQPFSLAGKRQGSSDDRYLWPHMLRIINQIRPTWVVGENVAGITSLVHAENPTGMAHQRALWVEDQIHYSRQRYIIDTICQDFEHVGYSVIPIIIPACAVGAWHRRDRVWFLAYTNGGRRSGNQHRLGHEETDLFAQLHPWFPFGHISEVEGLLLSQPGFIRLFDGVPLPLVRKQIKAFGNAIVPQVAYQIFKCIQQINLEL
ncbi:DNA (cytosine-5-)-methyltransferase [Chitinophaga sp. 180180018-2]|uniref:DNA cytosine methyltransferase n=1 Tax=unclassified Chitinophaga TaxID=2619133 RepID=UPI002DF68708|nr:DNA (cytosine-5-)-methyltransferase [Chitinophaga sp. 212800010-3]